MDDLDLICRQIEGDEEAALDYETWNLDKELRRVVGVGLETVLSWAEEIEP